MRTGRFLGKEGSEMLEVGSWGRKRQKGREGCWWWDLSSERSLSSPGWLRMNPELSRRWTHSQWPGRKKKKKDEDPQVDITRHLHRRGGTLGCEIV